MAHQRRLRGDAFISVYLAFAGSTLSGGMDPCGGLAAHRGQSLLTTTLMPAAAMLMAIQMIDLMTAQRL